MKNRFTIQGILFLAVLTLASLACQGGVPSLFATATPTYTITPSPVPTSTPQPTATAGTTDTTNISLETQSDGSVLFTDIQAGYSILIPSTWAGIPANADDISPYVEQAAENNPQFSEALNMLQNMDPNILRIIALDTTTEHYENGYAPNFSVLTMEDPISARMTLENIVKLTGSSITSQYQDAKLLNSGIETIDDTFSYGYNEFSLSINAADGVPIQIFQKQVYFSIEEYIVIITLSAPRNNYEPPLLEFDAMMSSTQIIDQ